MPGRRRVRRPGLVGVAAVILLLGLLAAPSVTKRFAPGCQRAVTLRVVVDPSVQQVVSDRARRLESSHRRVDGACVDVRLRTAPAWAVAGSLTGRRTPPSLRDHVWVPDSSVWVSLVRASAAGEARVSPVNLSVARSPGVLAVVPEAAQALGSSGARPGWGTLLGAAGSSGAAPAMRVGMPDPTRSSSGLTSLVSLEQAAAAGAPSWTNLDRAVLLMGLRRTAAADDTDPAAMLAAGVAAFPATEQNVWALNSAADSPRVVAVYPEEGAPAADFPYAVLRVPWASPETSAAADLLRDELAGAGSEALLSRHGLRAPSGRAGAFATPRLGLRPDTQPRLPTPDAATLARTLAIWKVAGQQGRVLAAVDVSGSMGFPVPGTDRTRMEVARAAGAEVVRLFDRRSELGVWVFSTRLDGARDHRVVLPVGPLGGRVGNRTRMEMVTGELSRLQPIVGGGTGLHDTALAAFREANATYRPGVLNVVVVLTDGVNDDPGSISRSRLLAAVREEFDPRRPVVFFTFGYGTRSDGAVLGDLAKLTGGRFYLSRDPTSIRAAFLDALLASAKLAPAGSQR